MKKRLGWILILLLIIFFIPCGLFADSRKVLVIPFHLNSDTDISDLRVKINDLLEKRFEEAGAIIIDNKDIERDIVEPYDAKNFGMEAKADYVVWGSIIWLGDRFSIDAKMIETFSKDDPQVFFADGQNAGNFFKAVKDIGEKIVIKLFKHETVADVSVSGNKRIEAAAILNKISTKKGDAFSSKKLSSDLQSIYKMGYFEDISIEMEEVESGKKIIFNIVEKPVVHSIKITGNDVYDDDEVKENLNVKIGSTLNIIELQTSVSKIEELYKSENYHNVGVKYKTTKVKDDFTDVEFVIDEGKKLRIRSIEFTGNSVYSNKKIKRMMKTREEGFLSWLTSSGELKIQDLDQDAALIEAFYQNNGYIFAKVGEPSVDYKEDGIYINIDISEGERFKVGKVELTGDVVKREQIEENIKIKKEEFFNREILREDILLMTDIYSDEGYANVRIIPITNEDEVNKVIGVRYNIVKGEQIYFDHIVIQGNTKTRDKVIRRELQVKEKELYSGSALKQSIQNLNRLDFFEDVQADTIEGRTKDSMGLTITVTEKATGTFSFGGGYSSLDKLYGVASITQRNFLGKGQTVALKLNTGSSTTRYDFSFMEPWMFDIPLSGRLGLFNWEIDYDTYDKINRGAEFEFGYPVWKNTRLYLSYLFEDIKISNIDEDEATQSILDMRGRNIESSITSALRYDSRNRLFNATNGSMHGISIQYAGIGSNDIAFTKIRGETSWYYPIFRKLTGVVHGQFGYVTQNSNGMLPTYERFNLGGINSLRGFHWKDLSPYYVRNNMKIYKGGNKFIQVNLEAVFPIFEKAGMAGVVFFDTGDVYDNNEDIEFSSLRESVGGGVRWLSPLGPIRVEYGHIIDPKEGETGGRWEFTIGSAF